MENPLAKIHPSQILRRETCVIEYSPIHIHNTAIGSQYNDGLRYRIDHLSELSLRLLNLLECHIQRRLRALALDSDSRDAARVVNQLNFAPRRTANFAKIHTEGSQHLSFVRNDRA